MKIPSSKNSIWLLVKRVRKPKLCPETLIIELEKQENHQKLLFQPCTYQRHIPGDTWRIPTLQKFHVMKVLHWKKGTRIYPSHYTRHRINHINKGALKCLTLMSLCSNQSLAWNYSVNSTWRKMKTWEKNHVF